MNSRLSAETKRRIDALFAPSQRDDVARLLQDECGNNLPMLENFDEVQLERFRFAALKLSTGSLPKLHDAVHLAKVDWRDLLVAAEFENDINAHKQWFPNNAAS
ncbi:hypothetical protein [Methylomonas sp. TEB]|uniref:hypothetical protein n=1 Tax=Methylomonas sp. TEB TaxID=3398229 RepID=UPI0039F5C2D2